MLWWCMTVTLAKALSPPIVVTALSTFCIFAGCSMQMYCLFGILNHDAGSDARSRSDSRGGAMRAKGVVDSAGFVFCAAERRRGGLDHCMILIDKGYLTSARPAAGTSLPLWFRFTVLLSTAVRLSPAPLQIILSIYSPSLAPLLHSTCTCCCCQRL